MYKWVNKSLKIECSHSLVIFVHNNPHFRNYVELPNLNYLPPNFHTNQMMSLKIHHYMCSMNVSFMLHMLAIILFHIFLFFVCFFFVFLFFFVCVFGYTHLHLDGRSATGALCAFINQITFCICIARPCYIVRHANIGCPRYLLFFEVHVIT